MKNKIDDFNPENQEEMLKDCINKINSLKLKLEQFNNYDEKYIEVQEDLIEQFETKKKFHEVLKEHYSKIVNTAIKISVIAAFIVAAILVICFTSPVSLGLAATIIALTSIVSVFEFQKADVKLKIIEGEISILNNEIETSKNLRDKRISKTKNLEDDKVRNDLLSLIEYYENLIYEILEDDNLIETEYIKEIRKMYYPETENSLEQKKLIKVKHNEV